MNIKKIFLMLVTFVSVFFYVKTRDTETIHSVSSNRPAELNLKVTKKKSVEETMYIDRENKRIFYFFGDEGLIKGDFLNVTEKLSEQGYTSKTSSKISGNKNELRYNNQEKNDNLKYGAERGLVKNRVVMSYTNEPKSIYIEFYDRVKKLKKIIKNKYEKVEIKEIFGELDLVKKEFIINFTKIVTELKEVSSKDKIEIFTFEKDGRTQNLDFLVEQPEGSEKGSIKIKMTSSLENVYLAHFDELGRLKKIYLLKDGKKTTKLYSGKNSYFIWNKPMIDITQWDRKNQKKSRSRFNTDIVYGTETISNGSILPYIDIKMGTLSIPNEVVTPKVSIENPNSLNDIGQVLLANEKNKNIVGRLYFKNASLAPKTPVKGLNYQEIVDSTSVIEFIDGEEKNADIYLRVYDLPETEESLFIAGKLKYLRGENSRNTIEVFDESGVILQKETLPEVEVVDIRDDIKEAIKISKKNINLSEEIGVSIGEDIQWTRRMKYVDIKLAEINIKGFENKTAKLKNPYIEISTTNSKSNKLLESSGNVYSLERFYLRLKNGTVDKNNIITQDEDILGYSKIGSRMSESYITDILADVIIRLTKETYESLESTGGNSAELKNENNTPVVLKVIFNEDYPEQALEIPFNSFNIIQSEIERKNNNVNIDALIYFNDIKENAFNLVFDPAKNSSGNISVRGNSESINSVNAEITGYSVFDMNKGIVSRTYKQDDIIEVLNVRGITDILETTADFSKDGYKSVTFKAKGMDFELKFWNNTDRVELSVIKSATPQSGEIYGEFLLKDNKGDVHNKVTLNIYSGIEKPGVYSDALRIWRDYTLSSEWGTEVEIVRTTTGTGSVPNLSDEGGLNSLSKPFVSYNGDSVFLEPIKGVGEQGIGSKALTLTNFTYKPNIGLLSENRYKFEPSGKGSVKVELTLTRDFIETYFPVGKPSSTYRMFEVAEIVYGKGKRRVPVSARLQLRNYGSATSSYPTREVSNHTEIRYYQTGLYNKTATVRIEDITPGEEGLIAEVTPTTVGVGAAGPTTIGKFKSFRGKNIYVTLCVNYLTTGTMNNAGIQLDRVILSKVPGLFGIFTMKGGNEQIKEHEIWIPKYSPIEEMESLASTLHTNKGRVRQYEKDFKVEKYDAFDKETILDVVKSLGSIKILGRDKTRADIIKRNSLTLNFAKLPDRIKLQPVNTTGEQIDGFLSFSNNSLIKEVEQKEGIDQELNVYLIISSENAKKINHGTKYSIVGEYETGRVAQEGVSTSNLLYYGLKTDNVVDLGLNEYIYEPIFKMDLNASIEQSSAVVLNLDNYSKKPLLKGHELSKNIRIYKSTGKYSVDVNNAMDYMNIEIQGRLTPYDSEKVEFKNKNHTLKVTEKETGKVFTGVITPQGGKVDVNGKFLNFTLQYSDNPLVKSGFNEAISLDILNIGINEYKFTKGNSRYILEHLDPDDSNKVLITDELLIRVPEFAPRDWYYEDNNQNSMRDTPMGEFKLTKGQDLIFQLGEIRLIPERDPEITKNIDDKVGVRIEYDKNITLEKLDDPSVKISGTLLLIDSNGNILPDESIGKESKILAISINKLQAGFDSNATFIARDLSFEKSDSIVNKPIRIGRSGQWQGLVKSISIEPSTDKVFGQFFKWNPSFVDITEWTGKRFKRSRSYTNFETGIENFLGKDFPYIDINMGTVTIPVADPKQVGDSIRLKSALNENTRGKIFIKNKNGDSLEGRLYFKSKLNSSTTTVMGKNNNPIEGATPEVIIKGLKEKKATIHLRIYDTEVENPSLFVEGVTEYIKNRISDNTIEILSEGKVLYTETGMPPVEFVDTRDSLRENILMEKRILDFTYNVGENAESDIQWALANRFVDVRLMGVTIDNFDDKVEKLKNPYIEIDTRNGIPSAYLEVNGNRITPYRYFIRLHNGKGEVEDEITEGSYIIGYKKISTNIEYGKVNNLKGDIVVRLLSEDYAKIKGSGSKTLNFKNSDGTVPKGRLVLNSDYPDRSLEVDLENYSILTQENDKLGKIVDLKTMLAMREINENTANLVFDYAKNKSGNIGLRAAGKSINDILSEVPGLSVFDMSGELLAQTYEKTDQIAYSSMVDTKDVKVTGATFEIEGYKSLSFIQSSTNIKYEVRFWNNTKKVEIFMDKSAYNGTSRGEVRGVVEVRDSDGNSKIKLNLVLSASNVDKTATAYVLRSGTSQGSGATAGRGAPLLFDENYSDFEYSPEWNTDIIRSTDANLEEPLDIAIANYRTYTGDKVTLGAISEAQENGLSKENFTLKPSTTLPYGNIENQNLVLDSNGNGRAKIEALLTREQMNNLWRDSDDNNTLKINALQITFGNGKRKIIQLVQFRYYGAGGIGDAYENHESEIIDNNQLFKLGSYHINSAIEIPKVQDENDTLYLDLPFPTDAGNYPSLSTRSFRGKEIGLRFSVSGSQNTKALSMLLNDIVLTKDREEFGIFRIVRPSTGGRERFIHKIISPKYNAVKEVYSSLSSLETSLDGKGKLLNQKLEILRDKLDDPTTTLGIVKNLGSVGLLGRDNVRGSIIKRNSTTMNTMKLPDKTVLQRIEHGEVKENINVSLSFSPTSIEKEFMQIESVDQEKNIYLHIEKGEAEKLIPGIIYSMQGEYDEGRISERKVTSKSIAYVGLKTDNTADLGLNEYIYDPLFQMNIQTEIAQDTSVKLTLSEDKPLIKSDGRNSLVRVYLAEAKYSTDITNPESYSSLSMRGLLTPYEYNRPEYGDMHDMVIRLEGSLNSAKIPLSKVSGGQGIIKTVVGDIYIGYLNNSDLTSGTVAGNPLEILTIGMKDYNFRGGSFKLNIEHIDPVTGRDILERGSLTITIPKFSPKKWYYNVNDISKLTEDIKSSVKFINNGKLIYPLGNVSLYSDKDVEITKGPDDLLGVRIEYDSEITLVSKENSGSVITGRIVKIDENGNIIPNSDIFNMPTQLAIVVDTNQAGYKFKTTYAYNIGVIDQVSKEKLNKPIRIGREEYWEGLVKNIELEPYVKLNWSSPLIDITNWTRKKFGRNVQNKEFVYGEEIFLGKTIPYIEIKVGEIDASNNKVIDGIRLKNQEGNLLLKNKKGEMLEGRIYLKSENTTVLDSVKDKNNNNIKDATKNIIFDNGVNKIATIHLRIYDTELENPSLFVEGVTEYIKNRISDNTIEILSEGKVLYTETGMPPVEFVDTRDSLRENILMEKRILDFTYNVGENAESDIQWALANRFVDVRLMGVTIDNFDDKVEKLKNPYIEIDTRNGIPSAYLEVNGNRITPYRYFIRLHNGKGEVEDEITEGSYIIGYKKISTNIEYGKVNNLKGDIVVRLLSEDYAKIKGSGSKTLNFKNSDGTVPKGRLVLNSDYPDRSLEVDLENYSILTQENDKLGKIVDLKTMLAMREINENTANLVFDYAKNKSGNIGLRAAGKSINDILSEVPGLSVFDMSGELLAQTYEKTDQIAYSSMVDTKDVKVTGATFEIEGYKSLSFIQSSTNIKYEVRFWNNTKKVEIFMDKSAYNGTSRGEVRGVVEVRDSDGNSKIKLNLVLSASNVDKTATAYVLRSGTSQGSGATAGRGAPLLFDENYSDFEYSPEWNTDIIRSTDANLEEPLDIAIANYRTYTGDKVTLGAISEAQENGLSKENFTLKPSTTLPYGNIENQNLVLDSNGNGRAKIEALLTREQMNNLWRDSDDNNTLKINALQITFGNGKRKIIQLVQFRYYGAGGIGDAYENHESEIIDNNQLFKLGSYHINSAIEIPKVQDENDTLYLDLPFPTDAGNYPSLSTRSFRGKEIGLRFSVSGSQNTKALSMLLNDIVLTKDREEFGIFRIVRPSTGGRERFIHKIISPKYNAVKEVYSSLSSLETSLDGKGKLLNQKLEILRDKLDDPTTTLGIVKNLGSVGLLGRDNVRGSIIKRNSTTMNTMKLPDKTVLQRIEHGEVKENINVSLSFSPTSIEKEFMQIESVDQEKNIYLHIEKGEAEKLIPGIIYSMQGEYDEGRISERKVTSKSIAYVGLKTDNTADLGLNEYIYDPLFQMNIQTEIAQDTSVKLTLSEDKPLIKSDGRNSLVRVYLAEAKYSTDITNPESYSSLSMRGLLTPYEYNKPEYGSQHQMIVRDINSGNEVRVELRNMFGGQGILKTVAGDIYIGYLTNPDLQNGTVAGNSLEILTIGMKTYNFRDGNLEIEIDHIDPMNVANKLTSEKFSLSIPRFLPKKWYYNAEDSLKVEKEATGSVKYIKDDKLIYSLGNVGLYLDRDLEITKDGSDTLGVRIEYDEEIELINKNNPSNRIVGKIVRIDSKGNILSHGAPHMYPMRFAVVVDSSQNGYSTESSYLYTGGSVDEISSNKTNKIIRIGREGYWEGLVKSIELKRVSMGELILNYDFNYPRGKEIEFDNSGSLTLGSGGYMTIKGDFISNVPDTGKVSIFKYVSEDNLYGEKLGEMNIVGGNLERPLEVSYKNGIETTYSLTFNKVANNKLNLTLNYWQEGIYNDRIVMRIEDKNGITSIYKLNLKDFDNKSVLTIEYDNSQMGLGVLPDELVNSLYFGSILNPFSYDYKDQRGRVESLNNLKISYYGKDLNIHDTIGRIELLDKDIIFKNDSSDTLVIEDVSIHRIYKRELKNSAGDNLYEEGFKLKGYFNPKNKVSGTGTTIDGRYRGTLRVNIEIY